MFIHTLESLEEFEDYIKQLEETVGLSTETYQEVTKAISKERDKLKNLSLSGVSKSVCSHNGSRFNPVWGQVVCGQCYERLE